MDKNVRRPHITGHTLYILADADNGRRIGDVVLRWQCRLRLNSMPISGWGDTPTEAWINFIGGVRASFPHWLSQHLVSILSGGR